MFLCTRVVSQLPRAGQTAGVLLEVPHPASDPMKSRRPGPSGGIAVRLAASTVAEAPPPDPSAEDANTRARDPALCVPPPARLRRHSRAATLNRCDIALLNSGAVEKWTRGREGRVMTGEFSCTQEALTYFFNRLGYAAGAGALHLVLLNITFGA